MRTDEWVRLTKEASGLDDSELVFVALQGSAGGLLGSRGESGGGGNDGGKDNRLHG